MNVTIPPAERLRLGFNSVTASLQSLVRLRARRLAFLLLFLGAGLLLVRPSEGRSLGFDNTASLSPGRLSHTATLLPNGQVLVAGGLEYFFGYPGPLWHYKALTSAALYDPATATWAATSSLSEPRANATATLLPNGKVLVVGGTTGSATIYARGYSSLASAEIFDPATGSWTTTGSLAYARSYHTATLLPDGKVLVAGGIQEPLGSGQFSTERAEVYDPATGTWTATGNLITARDSHTATLLSNGKVLVVGGQRSSSNGAVPLANVELYDPSSGIWTATADLIGGPRAFHTATLLPNGNVLVAGSYVAGSEANHSKSAEVYDPVSATWTATGSMAFRRGNHTATLLPDGQVLVAGGIGGNSNSFSIETVSAELYNAATGSWKSTGVLAERRRLHTATLLPNGTVLVTGGLGGYDGRQAIGSAERYGPKPTLLNISTRVNVQAGDNAMIGGFIISGTEAKTVIVRGIGPSLSVPGALADPIIEVHGPSGELLAANDNWRDATTRQEIADSGLAPSNDLEPALWGVINPGAYTVIVRGKNDATGIGLFEAYDLGEAADSNLGNISTRGLVQTGDNVLIGGLIVGGGTQGWTTKVLVRAIGPSVPVSGALADPTLELRDASGTLLAFNDNWKTRPDFNSQEGEIAGTGLQPTNDLESALLRVLPAGNYTAIVRGVNNTTGMGLVEAYNIP
jgi:N-acetylneuraminic acid mutarotase